MRIGVVFPQVEIGADLAVLRDYAQTAEGLGYTHLLAYDHVLGADTSTRPDWSGPYTSNSLFHEPMVFFGWLAAFTQLELVTGVIILPQRQTALFAKQAAELDVLSGGRVRIGVGVGWNAVEYEALGQDFRTRGRREEEQIGLMRRLWTEQSVTHEGDFDRVTGAGLAPPPVQRPIPVWLGGSSPAAYRRIGKLADGWFPQVVPGPQLDEASAIVELAAQDAGRDPSTLGMEGRISWTGDPADIVKHSGRWGDAGATHLSVNTMGAGLEGLDAHLDALAHTAEALSLT